MNDLAVRKFSPETSSHDFDIVVLAAGFEERSFEFLNKSNFGTSTHILIIDFENELKINKVISKSFRDCAIAKVGVGLVHNVTYERSTVDNFSKTLGAALRGIPVSCSNMAIDISGMPTHVVYIVLDSVRKARPYDDQTLIYTSASTYLPSFEEYEELVSKQGDDIEYLPKSMALEMSENLVLEPFSGYRKSDSNSCLILFAGYEAHRSTGVIEAINPTLLLLIYGCPPSEKMFWRQSLSERLHNKFERMLRCAREIVSTQNIRESLDTLDQYYNYLIDDYDVTIAPLGSKLQTVATFLFWERYPEVQINFPLPIGYDPTRKPLGVDQTYCVNLPGRLSYSQQSQSNLEEKK
ncbi:hypothetical protein [Hyphomonas sp.]|uniref:hypothetical protein n=1 Tax=Hyphomonas sp. TaxID=87 RepID=UPI003D2C1FC5